MRHVRTANQRPERILWDGAIRAIAAKGLHDASLDFPPQPLEASEWTLLIQAVRYHRLAGLLAAAVHDGDLSATQEQREEALGTHATAMRLCLELEADLLQTAELFARCGVQHRVLKGPAFAHLDYPDPAMRSFADIDLLVRSDHFDLAVEALTTAGFERKFAEVRSGFDRRFGKGASFRGPTGHELDLHRTFVMGPFGLALNLDDLWASSEQFQIAGRSFDTLDADQRFLHACYHAAIGRARPRLSPLRDLVGMLQRKQRGVDVDRALALSERWQSSAVVARAVELAWDAFALPDDPLARWAREFSPTHRDQQAMRSYLDLDMGYAARSYAALQAVPGVRAKAAFAKALLFPAHTYAAGRHDSRWRRWSSAGRQIGSLVWRAARR
jgi:hypothetical protein